MWSERRVPVVHQSFQDAEEHRELQ